MHPTAVRRYTVPWDGESRTLELPAARVTAELRFKDRPPLPDPAAAILHALENPIGARPLRDLAGPGARVALITGDRMTDRMLGARDRLDLKLDVLVNSDEQIVDLYAGDFRQEWRAAVAAAKEIWTTPIEPGDIAVIYPGDTRERYLSCCSYMTVAMGASMCRPDGAVIVTLSAAGGWSAEPESDRHQASLEQFALSSTEMARRMVRSQGNLRSLSNVYREKLVMERLPVYLHCDGFSDAEARELGFAGAFRTLEEALAVAGRRIGRPEGTIKVCAHA